MSFFKKGEAAMNNLHAATLGSHSVPDKLSLKIPEFWHQVGELLAEMRRRRKKSQNDFTIPARTLRRIEHENKPHIGIVNYIFEMRPCSKEMARLIRLLTDLMKPECVRCDPYCQMHGKTHVNFADLVQKVAVLPHGK